MNLRDIYYVELLELTRKLIPVVKEAGEITLKYFKHDPEIITKADGSPVTLADREAEACIKKHLTELYPDIPLVGEESVDAGNIPDISSGTFWLVDPLDGTSSFINGNNSFTVNIELMQNFKPVAGIIYAPVSREIFIGAEEQAFMISASDKETAIKTREIPVTGLTVTSSKRSKSHEAFINFLKGRKVSVITSKSSSIKFCEIAMGEADIYPRLGPTSEWDTAAGEAILNAAGGSIKQTDDTPLIYGKIDKKFLNPSFVAYGYRE